jgi:beta-lactamase regulating signal transducer with metallopeptidase domain
MNDNVFSITNLFDHSIAERIGLTIIHSVWQVALVAAIFAIAKSFLIRNQRSANKVYVAGMIALVCSAALPFATFMQVQPRDETQSPITMDADTRRELAIEMVSGSSESAFLELDVPKFNENQALQIVGPEEIGRRDKSKTSEVLWAMANWVPAQILQILTALWLAGVLLLSLKTLTSLVTVHHLKTSQTRQLSKQLLNVAQKAVKRYPVKQSVRFAISSKVNVPAVIGCLRPVILLPASVLTELNTTQLELIIIHELAHIRRHDFLLNIVQTVVEALLFFHPCVWWMSKIIRQTR